MYVICNTPQLTTHGFASVDIGFLRVTISNVTFSYISMNRYNSETLSKCKKKNI